MQKKNMIRLGVIAVVVAACLIGLSSSSSVKEKSTCCKENMDQCPQKKNNLAPGMIWEDFSRQFFSFASSSY